MRGTPWVFFCLEISCHLEQCAALAVFHIVYFAVIFLFVCLMYLYLNPTIYLNHETSKAIKCLVVVLTLGVHFKNGGAKYCGDASIILTHFLVDYDIRYILFLTHSLKLKHYSYSSF